MATLCEERLHCDQAATLHGSVLLGRDSSSRRRLSLSPKRVRPAAAGKLFGLRQTGPLGLNML